MRSASILAVSLLLPLVALAATININTANSTQLETLPGIGPTKAAAIIAYRTEHGGFKTNAEIQEVSGIGPATYAKLESLITVGQASQAAPEPTPQKPITQKSSYISVQEPIINTNVDTHEDEIDAPAAVTQVAAAGATVEPMALQVSPGAGIFHSVWTFGLVGVILIASTAFILL